MWDVGTKTAARSRPDRAGRGIVHVLEAKSQRNRGSQTISMYGDVSDERLSEVRDSEVTET